MLQVPSTADGKSPASSRSPSAAVPSTNDLANGKLRYRKHRHRKKDGRSQKQEDLQQLVQEPKVTIKVGRGRYRLDNKLGSGAFGEVFQGTCVLTGKMLAVKMEKRSDFPKSTLAEEAKMYEALDGVHGVPKLRWIGQEGNYRMMVMDMMGPNLQTLFEFCHKRFSMATIMNLGVQMVTLLEGVHARGVVHRDIKCENFVVGSDVNGQDENDLYVIDFGLSTYFQHPLTRQHVPYVTRDGNWGTMRYTSIRSHETVRQSRRDDLESIGFLLCYFMLNGSLPWSGLPIDDYKKKILAVRGVKKEFLERGSHKLVPPQWFKYMAYCRDLPFADKPDYSYLRGLFREVYDSTNNKSFKMDWSRKNYEKRRPSKNSQLKESASFTFDDFQKAKHKSPVRDAGGAQTPRLHQKRTTVTTNLKKEANLETLQSIQHRTSAIHRDWLAAHIKHGQSKHKKERKQRR